MSKKKPTKHLGLESLGDLVFSTGNEQESNEEEPQEAGPLVNPNELDLRVSLDKKNRKGKAATVVKGLESLHEDDLKDLAKTLKSKCGVGGSAKEGIILIQGDHVDKVIQLLKDEGFRVKRSGG